MKEAFGNIWEHISEYDAVVITTNGFVKKNGEAVMGRGIALEAAKRYKDFPARLGESLKKYGNVVQLFYFYNKDTGYQDAFFSFPVKPIVGPKGEPGWKSKADISLIESSAHQISLAASEFHMEKILLPRPGCGNGGLNWEQEVKPRIKDILDGRFTVMEFMPF